MLEQSLSTSGVSMSSMMKEGAEGGEATLEQNIQYSLGAQNQAWSQTTLRQGGAVVSTEIIGTLSADYNRYSHITTERTSMTGGPLDVSSIVGVWAKTENQDNSSQLISQAILGLSLPLGGIPVPIGSLAPEQRANLLEQIRNEGVYESDFSSVKREKINGRLHYVYEVKIQSIPYVHMIQEFSKQIGIDDLKNLDPNAYQGPPLTVQLTVDARSRQLVEVYLPDTDFRQKFSAYGVPVAVNLPEQTVSREELQGRLNQLQ